MGRGAGRRGSFCDLFAAEAVKASRRPNRRLIQGVRGLVERPDVYKRQAVSSALAQARGEAQEAAQIAFTPGTYEGTAAGYNGDVVLSVTFTEDAIESIEVCLLYTSAITRT